MNLAMSITFRTLSVITMVIGWVELLQGSKTAMQWVALSMASSLMADKWKKEAEA